MILMLNPCQLLQRLLKQLLSSYLQLHKYELHNLLLEPFLSMIQGHRKSSGHRSIYLLLCMLHINRKSSKQVEIDWAGDSSAIIAPDTGEILKAYIFIYVMTYNQYAYVEAFLNMKQKSWITAHVHMYEFFGDVTRILVLYNCKTAVIHNEGWKDQHINKT